MPMCANHHPDLWEFLKTHGHTPVHTSYNCPMLIEPPFYSLLNTLTSVACQTCWGNYDQYIYNCQHLKHPMIPPFSPPSSSQRYACSTRHSETSTSFLNPFQLLPHPQIFPGTNTSLHYFSSTFMSLTRHEQERTAALSGNSTEF